MWGMDIRERHIGGISNRIDDGPSVEVDVGLLIRRLLLFEHCTLESDLLMEIPHLARVFGVDGLKTLLEANCFSIICDALQMGSIGQNEILKITAKRGGPLPLSSYRIVPITIADRAQYIHNALQIVHQLPGTNLKQQIKLKSKIVSKLGAYPSDLPPSLGESFKSDVYTRPNQFIRPALEVVLKEKKGIELPQDVDLYVDDLGNDGDFRVRTNLGDRIHLSDEESHILVQNALLGAAGLEVRLGIMRTYSSLSGFRESEFPIFEHRVNWLADQLDPSVQEKRFERIVAIAGLPGLECLPDGQRIDIERLLDLRNSDECRDFRKWLRDIDSETDREIEERFASVRERLAKITHTKTARVIRFMVENGVSAIPGLGIIAGPVMSLSDTFIIEKLVGRPGPVSFLSSQYPSIFSGIDVSLDELMGVQQSEV